MAICGGGLRFAGWGGRTTSSRRGRRGGWRVGVRLEGRWHRCGERCNHRRTQPCHRPPRGVHRWACEQPPQRAHCNVAVANYRGARHRHCLPYQPCARQRGGGSGGGLCRNDSLVVPARLQRRAGSYARDTHRKLTALRARRRCQSRVPKAII